MGKECGDLGVWVLDCVQRRTLIDVDRVLCVYEKNMKEVQEVDIQSRGDKYVGPHKKSRVGGGGWADLSVSQL